MVIWSNIDVKDGECILFFYYKNKNKEGKNLL